MKRNFNYCIPINIAGCVWIKWRHRLPTLQHGCSLLYLTHPVVPAVYRAVSAPHPQRLGGHRWAVPLEVSYTQEDRYPFFISHRKFTYLVIGLMPDSILNTRKDHYTADITHRGWKLISKCQCPY